MAKKISKQKTFDIVARHLLTQARKSLSPSGGVCYYRGRNGTMCAAGCLIPNDLYKQEFEGDIVDPESGVGKLIMSLGYDLGLVRALQNVHDHRGVPNWKSALKVVASVYKLKTKVLSKF